MRSGNRGLTSRSKPLLASGSEWVSTARNKASKGPSGVLGRGGTCADPLLEDLDGRAFLVTFRRFRVRWWNNTYQLCPS